MGNDTLQSTSPAPALSDSRKDLGELGHPTGTANRLSREKSPYLLQHKDNPGNWYPWGAEAFEKAKKEDKLILLSIGYSTCHWCHVMAHESFEDPEVADLMNESFVSIKVDREERPDIDAFYMDVCQAITGSGGWPLTVIMTPDKKAIFAGTYFPKRSRHGRIGMVDLLPKIGEVWRERRDEALASAEEILAIVERAGAIETGEELGEEVLHAAYRGLAGRFDSANGGFGRAPKFPTPHNLLFLLRYWKRTGESQALAMVEKTLTAMRRGGVYDHVGFGFHRYSTDARWFLPHFEKMLYDQALLAWAYTEAFQATGKEEYARTANEIFTYVLRDLTSPEGGFYSAEDADSEGEEGKFYMWKREELIELLGEKEGEIFSRTFGVVEGGNFEEESTGRKTGANVLHLAKPVAKIARDLGLKPATLEKKLEASRQVLFSARKERPRPLKDTKILADWNGLMIVAFATAGRVFGNPAYTLAAKKAASFLLAEMREAGGRLLHRYRDGEVGLPAHADDYAFVTWGLIELYQATHELPFLKEALALNRVLLVRFWDEEKGGFFFTADDTEKLPLRKKEIYDGAMPSGNSVAHWNLTRLGRLTGDDGLEKMAGDVERAFSRAVKPMPMAYTQLLIGVNYALGPSSEVVIVGERGAEDTLAIQRALRREYMPNMIVIFKPQGKEGEGVGALIPYAKNHEPLKGRATAFVCREARCHLPTTDIAKVLNALGVEKE
mgnify:CR=1 FL=1